MGSFIGHMIPGTLFVLIGLWHSWCSLVRFISNPKSFRMRVWNPVPGKFKHLELYVIVVGGFIDLCIEFFVGTHLQIIANGSLNPAHLNNFEHSGMLLMFFIFGVIALISEKTSILPLPEGALCFIASAAFTAEYLLFYFHSTAHTGLEGYYHFILVILIGLCVVSTAIGALISTSFPVDLCSGISITLQGLWFYQTAFTLYGPMMPEGCLLKPRNEISCGSNEAAVRGSILANALLFTHVLVVLGALAGAYAYLERRSGSSTSQRDDFE